MAVTDKTENQRKDFLECYNCKGIYFKVICQRHEYDTVDVLAFKCVECENEIELKEGNWAYGGVRTFSKKSK